MAVGVALTVIKTSPNAYGLTACALTCLQNAFEHCTVHIVLGLASCYWCRIP